MESSAYNYRYRFDAGENNYSALIWSKSLNHEIEIIEWNTEKYTLKLHVSTEALVVGAFAKDRSEWLIIPNQ